MPNVALEFYRRRTRCLPYLKGFVTDGFSPRVFPL